MHIVSQVKYYDYPMGCNFNRKELFRIYLFSIFFFSHCTHSIRAPVVTYVNLLEEFQINNFKILMKL